MKNRSIGLGFLFILLGIGWLMVNTGYLNEWSIRNSISVLWPLLLVVLGVNILFKKNPVISVILWVLFAAAVIGYSLYLQQDNDLIPGADESVIVENTVEYEFYGFSFDSHLSLPS